MVSGPVRFGQREACDSQCFGQVMAAGLETLVLGVALPRSAGPSAPERAQASPDSLCCSSARCNGSFALTEERACCTLIATAREGRTPSIRASVSSRCLSTAVRLRFILGTVPPLSNICPLIRREPEHSMRNHGAYDACDRPGVSVLRDLAADARVAARRSPHASTQVVLSDVEADALLTDARLLARIASDIEVLAEDFSTGEKAR